jgi:hypothetical protein
MEEVGVCTQGQGGSSQQVGATIPGDTQHPKRYHTAGREKPS